MAALSSASPTSAHPDPNKTKVAPALSAAAAAVLSAAAALSAVAAVSAQADKALLADRDLLSASKVDLSAKGSPHL